MVHDWCYTIILGKPAGENVGAIKRGEGGYYALDYNWGDTDEAEKTARWLNNERGISEEDQREMEIKSMFHWGK